MDCDSFANQIDKKFETREQMAVVLAHLIGASGVLVDYIADIHTAKELPIKVRYLIVIIANNVNQLISDENLDFRMFESGIGGSSYKMCEQTQENVHRTMKRIITEIYQSLEINTDDL